MVCDVSVTDYVAVYAPNVHNCDAGEYLPANIDECRPCPAGYECSGGTYNFNPDYFQGAIADTVPNNTMNNICAANFPSELVAVYAPNTITINWSDVDESVAGQNNENTVTYDGDIRTPIRAAHKPGKQFVGWVFSAPQ